MGLEHADTRATSSSLVLLVNTKTQGITGQVVAKSGSVLLQSMQTAVQAPGQANRVEISTAHDVKQVLQGLWHDLPSLEKLQELQLRELQGLDSMACGRLAVTALGALCLQSVDLRFVNFASKLEI